VWEDEVKDKSHYLIASNKREDTEIVEMVGTVSVETAASIFIAE